MDFNYLVLLIAGVVPLITGFIWYGPLFKNAWMKEMGFTEESMQGANMPLIFGLSYVLGVIIAAGLMPAVIHQMGMYSTLVAEAGFSEQTGDAYTSFTTFIDNYGDRFRTFKHGALHGGLIGLFIAMPILSIQAMFERKTFKYVAINVGYWTITLALMGGIICQWL